MKTYRVQMLLLTAALPWLMGATLLSCHEDGPLQVADGASPGRFNPDAFTGPVPPACQTDLAMLGNSVGLALGPRLYFSQGTVPAATLRDAGNTVWERWIGAAWLVPGWETNEIQSWVVTGPGSNFNGVATRAVWIRAYGEKGDCRLVNTAPCHSIEIAPVWGSGHRYRIRSGWRLFGSPGCWNEWLSQRVLCRYPPPPDEVCHLPNELVLDGPEAIIP